MRLSIVVISHDMTRELPRTLRSLSPAMQRGIGAQDYEVIVVDNGSRAPLDEGACRLWLPDLILHRMENPSVSPAPAVNRGLRAARGELVGVFIDGARMATPGLLASALAASRLFERPAIGTLAFHLGHEVQMESVGKGYDQVAEDALLRASGWEEDGYRLFDVAVLADSSRKGWFALPAETNALFLKAAHWLEIGGFDESFVSPGGGLANHDVWARICADPLFDVLMLFGEATFHQVHGGVATNSPVSRYAEFHAEYERIRGHPFVFSDRKVLLFGSPPPNAMRWIAHSLALARASAASDPSSPNGISART